MATRKQGYESSRNAKVVGKSQVAFHSPRLFLRNILITNESQHPDSNRGLTDYKSMGFLGLNRVFAALRARVRAKFHFERNISAVANKLGRWRTCSN